MSCRACVEAQEKYEKDNSLCYPVRVGSATIFILACRIHAKWAIEQLRRGARAEVEDEKADASHTSIDTE